MQEKEFLDISKRILANMKGIAVEDVTITLEDSFSAYGLDSLDIMNFFLELDEAIHQNLAEVDPEEYNTLAKVFTLIE